MNSAPIPPTTVSAKPTDEQTTDLLCTVQHIEREIAEAHRLRQLRDSLLNVHERNWVNNVIAEVEEAADAVTRALEPCRVERETSTAGKLGIGRKMLWMLRDNQKVKGKYSRLIVAHQSLTSVISFLHSRAQAIDDYNPLSGGTPSSTSLSGRSPEGPPSYELSQVLGWRQSKQQSRLRAGNPYPGTGKAKLAELE